MNQSNDNFRGYNREKELSRDEYFSDQYFTMQQLCSFAHQINHINSLKPKSILEIGIGNGFVSTFLKRAGYFVTTADINPNLDPEICAPIESLGEKLQQKYDLVVCCEVLEHMPLNLLNTNIELLSSFGRRLYLTLPSCRRIFGFGGIYRLPKCSPKII